MIAVNVSTTGISVDGHAGYDDEGKDIVCSAVTMLVFNLINSMEALTEDKIEVDCQEDNRGHVKIGFKDLSEQGKLLVDSFFIGISEVLRAYPEYVQII